MNVQVRAQRRLRAGDGLVCGGQMEVFIEPVEPSPELYVFGAGHVGYFVGRRWRTRSGFQVHVIDDREKFANTERFGDGIDVMVDDIPTWLQHHQLPPTSYAVIVTRGHTHDLDALRALARIAAPLPRADRQQGEGEAHLRRAARGRDAAEGAASASTRRSASTSARSRRRRSPSASSPS